MSLTRSLALPIALVLLGSSVGCYSSWPPIGSASPLGEINNSPNVGACATAGRWAVAKIGAQGTAGGRRIALNVPDEFRRSNVLAVASATGTSPLTPESAQTSTVIHIPRVWIRADRAEVDVMYPNPAGEPSTPYLMATLYLRGGGNHWTIEVAREWESLLREVPELHYLPAQDYPDWTPEQERPTKTNFNNPATDAMR